MRGFSILLAVICSGGLAHAEPLRFGGMLAGRFTNLDGQLASDPSPAFAAAGVVALPLTATWLIATEPGVRWAGSAKYPLVYASLPVLAVARYPIGHAWAARASAGLVPSILAKAELVTADDDGDVRSDIRDHLRWWDLGVMAGLGVERASVPYTYFAELRWSRGLATIHADDPALFVVNEELGLWIGITR